MKLPSDLNIYQTSGCNFECGHCRRATVDDPYAPDFDLPLLQKVLKIFPIKSVCIAGFGEPLMSRAVFRNIRLLNSRGIAPGLITNGSLILKHLEELKKTKLVYLSVSLNYIHDFQHEAATGTKAFFAVVEGIKELRKRTSHTVGISKVCFKDEVGEIPEVLRFAGRLGLDFVHFTNALSYADGDLNRVITEDDKEELFFIDGCKPLVADGGMKVKWPVPVLKENPHACTSPMRTIGIDGSGYVTGCRRILPPSSEFGHCADSDVWNTSRDLIDLRNAVGGYVNKYTRTCDGCFGNYKGVRK